MIEEIIYVSDKTFADEDLVSVFWTKTYSYKYFKTEILLWVALCAEQ